jgi:putative ABC transport system permease protein
MRKLRELVLRLGGLFNKQRKDGELDEEIESHVQLHTDDNLQLGMTPDEARRRALIKFGGIESAKEAYRDQRGLPFLDTLWQDIRYGARMLAKNPGFTVVAVITLALGIGANTAIFSFAYAIVLRPLPFKDPEKLVMVFTQYPSSKSHQCWISAPTFIDWRKQSTAFEGLAARGFGGFVLTGKGLPENIPGSRISANTFRLLGLQPTLGRDFAEEEETYGNDHVVLLGNELWKRRFGGDLAVVGSSITLNDELYTVVGVMPPRTFFPEHDTQIWTPMAFSPEALRDYRSHNYLVYGRLKAGETLSQANQEMNVVASRLAETDENYKGSGAEVFSLQEMVVGNSRVALLALLGSVAMVLLVGCVNIANLLLARSATRSREFAIRGALGASRKQVIRQLLTEGVLLAGLGGMGGILLAFFGLEGLVRFSPSDLPRIWEGVHLDMRALGFTALVVASAGLLFGLAPALQCSVSNLVWELNEGARGSTGGKRNRRVRSTLVVCEVALSVMLLVGAGLMLRSFSHLISQDLGYNPEHVVSFDLGLPWKKYPTLNAKAHLFQELKTRVDNLPGVQASGLVRGLPLSGQNSGGDIDIKGVPSPTVGEAWDADFAQASPGYFRAMNIPFVAGRDFNERDGTNATPVAIVNETFVKKFKLGTNALGRLIGFAGATDIEIVGVVKDTKRSELAAVQRAEAYRPYTQQCWGFMSLVVRTQIDPVVMARMVRVELDRLDKDQPIENVHTMTQLVSKSVTPRRLVVQILTGFGGLAMLLAAIGLYGVLAYNVSQGRREIGVRMALGARPRDVLSLVLAQGMKLAFAGVVIGGGAAFALTRLMRNLLYQTAPSDPLTFMCVSLLLIGVAFLACWWPARRAAEVDPIVALRHE